MFLIASGLLDLPNGEVLKHSLKSNASMADRFLAVGKWPNKSFDRRHRRLSGQTFADGDAPVNSFVRRLKLNGMRILLQIILVAAFGNFTIAQNGSLPRCEDYPAKKTFLGKPAPVKIAGTRARMYRTVIREWATEKPNFAGHYIVARWGCGTGCVGYAVIDARTGKVYFNPEALQVAMLRFQDEDHLQYRLDSRLLVVSGDIMDASSREKETKLFFEWKGNRFRLIRKASIKMGEPVSASLPNSC